jgi:hypothetical protein
MSWLQSPVVSACFWWSLAVSGCLSFLSRYLPRTQAGAASRLSLGVVRSEFFTKNWRLFALDRMSESNCVDLLKVGQIGRACAWA